MWNVSFSSAMAILDCIFCFGNDARLASMSEFWLLDVFQSFFESSDFMAISVSGPYLPLPNDVRKEVKSTFDKITSRKNH